MLRSFALRLLASIPLAIGVATLVFLAAEAAPGEPLDQLRGDLPPEVVDRMVEIYGLDGSPLERYLSWIGALFLRGDLGWSHLYDRPVTSVLASALWASAQLALVALVLHVVAGVGLGLLSARRKGKFDDRLLTAVTLGIYAMPIFWLGLMAVLVFGEWLGWLPTSSPNSPGMQAGEAGFVLDRLHHLILPAGVLAVASAAGLARFVRAGLIETLALPFARAARARGLDRKSVLVRHALRASLLPLINLVGLALPGLLSGALVIEYLYSWPGMGRLTYEAARGDDTFVLLATTVVAAWLVIAGNLLADVAMRWADPRVRA